MYKISVVGIDNTGKTSVVESLDNMSGVSTIHLTTCQNNDHRFARFSGRLVNRLAEFGEERDSKFITGFAYLMHLFPYKLEERTKADHLLVSDRDPIVDTLCYSDFYLSCISKAVRPSLKFFLEHSFNYPDSVIYLEATPEESVSRNHQGNQLHEITDALSRLKELFDEQMFFLEKKDISIIRIDTGSKSLDEVTDEVRFHIDKV